MKLHNTGPIELCGERFPNAIVVELNGVFGTAATEELRRSQ